MALDIKIEVFAFELFEEVWNEKNLTPIQDEAFLLFAEEGYKDPDYECLFRNEHFYAVFCRICFFKKIYSEEVRRNLSKILFSEIDFYEYFLCVCHDTDLFDGLTIFERVFATCAFVAIMSIECYNHGFGNCVDFAYLCWAMYFDKYSTEFYSKGGWSELERVADSYSTLFEFLKFYEKLYSSTPDFLGKIASAVGNYQNFECTTRFSDLAVYTKDWIIHSRESYLKKYATIFPPKESPSSKEKVEELLVEIRLICDFEKSSAHYAELSKVAEELDNSKNLTFTSNSNSFDGSMPSIEVNPKTFYADAQTDSSNSMLMEDSSSDNGARICLPISLLSSSRLPMKEKQNASCEADYSPSSGIRKLVDTLSGLLVLAKDIEGKRNDMLADNGASSSACHSNTLKLQSVSSIEGREHESFSETLETHIASFLLKSLNLENKSIDSSVESIRETSTLKPSPFSIRKQIQTLDVQKRGEKIRLRQEKNFQNPANMTSDQEEEIISGIDSKQLNNIPGDFALRKIDEPFDMNIVFCEESNQQQHESKLLSSFTMVDSVFDDECSRSMTDEDNSKKKFKQLGYKCAETTMEWNKTDQFTGDTCEVFQENVSLSKEDGSPNTVGASKKKKKHKETKKQIQLPEQESNDVNDLLRMILVLGDTEGIKYVCSSLQGAYNARS